MTRLTSPETELRMERGNYIAFFKKVLGEVCPFFLQFSNKFCPHAQICFFIHD